MRGDGLVVGASNITINLNGHAIGGTGSGAGIDSGAYAGIQIVGGTIQGFQNGISLCIGFDFCSPFPFQMNVMQFLDIHGNTSGGIIEGGPASTNISQNTIHDNGGDAIDLYYRTVGDITDNQIYGNAGLAVYRDFDADGTTARNNIHNDGGGIFAYYSPSTIVDNTVRHVGGDGIETADLSNFLQYYYVASNTTDDNAGYGIDLVSYWINEPSPPDPSVEDGGGNAAKHNGLTPDCVANIFVSVTPIPCAFNRGQAKKAAAARTVPLHANH